VLVSDYVVFTEATLPTPAGGEAATTPAGGEAATTPAGGEAATAPAAATEEGA